MEVTSVPELNSEFHSCSFPFQALIRTECAIPRSIRSRHAGRYDAPPPSSNGTHARLSARLPFMYADFLMSLCSSLTTAIATYDYILFES